MQLNKTKIKKLVEKNYAFTQMTFDEDYVIKDNKPDVLLIVCATNFECLNSSENTTESTAKVLSLERYFVQSIFFTPSYTSSGVRALKRAMGLSIFIAVCNWKLAR